MMTKIDLSDKAIAAALNRVLDEIAETARATSPTGRMSARLIGRVLAVRLGIPVWTGQTAAKRRARGARWARM
jgi:hypothetical protein